MAGHDEQATPEPERPAGGLLDASLLRSVPGVVFVSKDINEGSAVAAYPYDFVDFLCAGMVR